MKRLAFTVLVWAGLLGWFCQNSYAQVTAGKIKNFTTALNNIRELKPIEKLYLQTDKPYYSLGDTLRFKGYLLNADYLTPSLSSGLLYVELDDAEGKSAKRIMVPVVSGLAWGDISLDSVEVPNGSYTLRAYTNWMRNFGEDYVFKKPFIVSKSSDNPLLVKANFKQAGNKAEAELLFSLLDGRIQAFKDVELKVMNGRKNLSKDKVVTNADGSVKVNFTVPEGNGALSIQASTAGSGLLNIPVSINRRENTDVQFMPEGGPLVAGLPAKVGFKAIGEDGKGFNISGKVLDSKGKQVAVFASAHACMGSFEFTPVAAEAYIAKVDGIAKDYSLPAVKLSGTSLSVKQATDSIQVTVLTTANARGPYFLIGHARGVVCYAESVSISDNLLLRRSIARTVFPTGVIRFSLFNGSNQVLNERSIFIDHHDDIRISVDSHKSSYGIRDSIALAIKVTDKDGKPVEGNFSLSVTDNSQVKIDSLGSNILNNLLLASDLRGNVEDPGYYFMENKKADLDNLMLTQGWVGYSWNEVLYPKLPLAYQPEKEFVITGKVSTAFGKPIEKSNVVLFANNPPAIKDTVTDNAGQFVFKDLFPVDTTAFFKLQARNKRGKEMNVKIDMDEFKAPDFNPGPLTTPWYLNIDSILLNNSLSRIAEERALSNYRGEGNLLKEAKIKAKKIVRGSRNLNGPGEADQIIDEEEIKKLPVKTTLEELLLQKLPGFIPQGGLWSRKPIIGQSKMRALSYVLNAKRIRFVFDGIDLDFFFTGKEAGAGVDARYYYIKPILDYFTAEDISGIEIMKNLKYTSGYHTSLASTNEDFLGTAAECYAFIEITTRAKKGPFMKVTPGTFLYKAQPFQLATQFYSPKYTVKNKALGLGTDLRSTVFWAPNVVTDKEGKATISFYSADKAANYTVIMEGTDMGGGLGIGGQQIKVK